MSPLDFVNFSDENSMAFQHIDDALRANVSQVMRRAEYILRSKIDLPRARCESAQEAMLRSNPGHRLILTTKPIMRIYTYTMIQR
jgi:hypothetical protein